MKYALLEKLDKNAISGIIDFAWNAEACRDVEGAIVNFAPIWSNIDEDPDFTEFEDLEQAYLLRLAGNFLSYYGKARNRRLFQERGKNLISESIRLFLDLGYEDPAAEAQIALALCYFWEGAILETETILEQTAEEFIGNQLHPVYLKSRVNLLLTQFAQKKYQEALYLIDEIRIPMEFCEDKRTCSVFHEKAGLIYRGVLQYDKAVWHYNEAIRFASETNNFIFVSSIRNNLAFLYNKIGEFELAHLNCNEALKIAQERNQSGWLPHYIDTQALIYANEGFLDLALETIGDAINIFRKGEDAGGLTEAIWNKCKFLLQLNRKEEALLLFSELIPIASQRMGEFAVKNFTKEFSNLIHIKQDGSLHDEIRRFKRVEIVDAIRAADYNVNQAAEALKMNPTLLCKTIDKEFPELYQELSIQPPAKLDGHSLVEIENAALSVPKHITRLMLHEVEIAFEDETRQNFTTFYFSKERMLDSFGISEDAIVAIAPLDKLSTDDFILVEEVSKHIYSFGKTQFDENLDLFYLADNDEPKPLAPSEVKVIGKAIGYCPFDESNADKLVFRSFLAAPRL